MSHELSPEIKGKLSGVFGWARGSGKLLLWGGKPVLRQGNVYLSRRKSAGEKLIQRRPEGDCYLKFGRATLRKLLRRTRDNFSAPRSGPWIDYTSVFKYAHTTGFNRYFLKPPRYLKVFLRGCL